MTFDLPPPLQASVEDDKVPTIYAVVEAGKEYTQQLARWSMALYYLTPLHHQDQRHLHHLVEGEPS